MIIIRNQTDSDTKMVKSIVAGATDELRSIYRPVKTTAQKKVEKPVVIVAIIKDEVAGVAEYFINKNNLLVRGLAVSPVYRRQGVASSIIEHVIVRAQKEGKTELVLSTIKETGNIKAFLHMGFTVTSEAISKTFEGAQGEQVTVITMCKKF